MPFLRVIRDKRGYETTYLMHWYRDGSRQRSRILYMFRSPGGVRVGRQALDQDVVHLIETQNPDIMFDWNVVRDNQQIVESVVEPRRRKQRREELLAEPTEQASHPAVREEPQEAAPAPVAVAPRPPIPAAIQGATPDEQIAFLTEWYPKVRERVPQRTSDPARQEALLALAERLNPLAWTDADQITAGLQQASEALERLSRVFAKRRRRQRRRAGDRRPAEPAGSESSGS